MFIRLVNVFLELVVCLVSVIVVLLLDWMIMLYSRFFSGIWLFSFMKLVELLVLVLLLC